MQGFKHVGNVRVINEGAVPSQGFDELLPQEKTGMNYETRSDALGHRFRDSSPFVSGCNLLGMF